MSGEITRKLAQQLHVVAEALRVASVELHQAADVLGASIGDAASQARAEDTGTRIVRASDGFAEAPTLPPPARDRRKES